MHVAMDFCFGVANDTRPGGRLLSANKKQGEVNLDDLDVGRRSHRKSALLWRLGGSYVIIWGKATSCFRWREPEVVCPPVSSPLRFVW
jgi:hypothetical protein